MPVPDFSPGEVLTASAMDSIGLWLVKTQTVGAGVGSVTVTDAFSADYDRYLITWNGGVCSGSPNIFMTLGSTVTGYYFAGFFANYAGGSAGFNSGSNTTSFDSGYGSTTNIGLNVELQEPFATRNTLWRNTSQAAITTSFMNMYAGYLNNTTSYTSFTFTASSGTMTGGIIRVYGYRK
jgi:hypothetical protein